MREEGGTEGGSRIFLSAGRAPPPRPATLAISRAGGSPSPAERGGGGSETERNGGGTGGGTGEGGVGNGGGRRRSGPAARPQCHAR